MKLFKQKDIVLINVFFSEGIQSKIRLVLIISNSSMDKVNEFIFLPITGTDFNDNFGFPLRNNMVVANLPTKLYQVE